MLSHEAAGLAAIRALYAEPIVYTGAGLAGAAISAIPSNTAAGPFQGPADTIHEQTFEIARSLLPQRPAKTDTLVHGGVTWKVINVDERLDVDAWVLAVELP